METLLSWWSGLNPWQLMGAISAVLLQGMVFGAPEEIVVATVGLLWSQGRLTFIQALIAVWAGLLTANSLTVFIGSRFGETILQKRPFSWVFKKQAIDEALEKIKRHPQWIIFFTRFTPMIRGPIYFATGLSKMKVFHFFRIDFLAACIQVPLLLLLGNKIGKNAGSMMEAYQKIGFLMIAIILGVILFQVISKKKKDKKLALS